MPGAFVRITEPGSIHSGDLLVLLGSCLDLAIKSQANRSNAEHAQPVSDMIRYRFAGPGRLRSHPLRPPRRPGEVRL